MDYENLYKKALERARVWKEKSGMPKNKQGILDDIFPELKESEDERIRKGLINYFNHHKNGINIFYGIKGDDILAWLEKQGEFSDQIHYWTEEEIEPIISDYLRGTEHYGGMIARLRCLKPKSLEKQGEQKPIIEMKSAEESLGIDSDTYNEIVDKCIYGEQKSQRMISAEAKEAMYDKPADTIEQKCEESKTKIFDAPTPFEDKLYAFVAACEFLAIPSKIEFILEHSQEILDAAREQIGKEQSSTWSKEDEKEYKYVLKFVDNILNNCGNKKDYEHCKRCYDWLKSLKERIGG